MRRFIVNLAYKLKPLILRLFPRKLIFAVRQKITGRVTGKIKQIKIRIPDEKRYKFGINLVADIKAETSLGQSARLLAGLIKESGIPMSIKQYDLKAGVGSSDIEWDGLCCEDAKYLINIVHINPCQLEIAFSTLGEDLWHDHYNIAFWLWEMEEFPDEWTHYFNLFDEVWTPSEFISKGVRAKTDKPVRTLPYYLLTPTDENVGREFFKLPKDKFLYLMMYDSGSIAERKNPTGVIEAYKLAYPKEDPNVGLVLKMRSFDQKEENHIREMLEGYKNVYIITGSYPKTYVNSLIKSVDVLISLHRAEGFGLPLAEAMKLGKPVIATDYSANTEFMNEEVACMVGYQTVSLKKNMFPYKKSDHWADPDIGEAAGYIRRMYEDRSFRAAKALAGKNYVDKKLGRDHLVSVLNSFLQEVKSCVGGKNDKKN